MLQNLFSKDPAQVIPKDFSAETEEDYFDLLKSPEIGKALSNISEFLLETEGLQGKSKVYSQNFANFYRTQPSGLELDSSTSKK